jgi:hypothetical protein
MFGEAYQMKFDVDPFSVDMINFEEKRVLVCTDQAKTTEGQNDQAEESRGQGLEKKRAEEEAPRMEAHV